MDAAFVASVRERAGFACEYCRLPDYLHALPFEVEHIIPRQHGGRTLLSNCAYACLRCNRYKGTNLVGLLRVGSRQVLVKLFHPRRHKWTHHFRWDGPILIGKTRIGGVTIQVLAVNDPIRVAIRQSLMEEGSPPGAGA